MLHTVTCITCETQFGLPKNIFVLMQENHIPIHCPMGHVQNAKKKEFEKAPTEQKPVRTAPKPSIVNGVVICPVCNTSIEQEHFHEHIVLHIKGRAETEFPTQKRIKIMRVYYGLSQKNLAKNLRLRNQAQVSHAELGKTIPGMAYSVLKSWADDEFKALLEEARKGKVE